jgi:hypothetical protein
MPDFHIHSSMDEIAREIADEPALMLDLLSDILDRVEAESFAVEMSTAHSLSVAHRRVAPFLAEMLAAMQTQEYGSEDPQ